jgi:Fe-S-cluster containining protein
VGPSFAKEGTLPGRDCRCVAHRLFNLIIYMSSAPTLERPSATSPNDLPESRLAEHPLKFIARPTPQLRATVEQQQASLPPEQFAEMMVSIRSVFRKFTAKLAQFHPGVDRGRALHEMIEREMGAVAFIQTSCGKGCSGCCSYEVEVTQNEAAILKERVLGGYVIDRDRLRVQAARERKSPEWRRFGNKDNRCVFLGDDGACQIYEDRPAICRKHMVTTPAAACTTEGAAVAPVQVLLAEILLSAEASLEGTEIGSLAKMLKNALDEAAARPGFAGVGLAKPPARVSLPERVAS